MKNRKKKMKEAKKMKKAANQTLASNTRIPRRIVALLSPVGLLLIKGAEGRISEDRSFCFLAASFPAEAGNASPRSGTRGYPPSGPRVLADGKSAHNRRVESGVDFSNFQ